MQDYPWDFKRIANLLIEAGTLKKIARSHRQQLYTDDLSDNIASHSFRVCIIACCLALILKGNLEKVLLMALFHDFGEVRSGDQNWLQKRYICVDESRIRHDQLKDIFPGDRIFWTMEEYEERQSLEAQIAKDADRLEQMLLEKEYAEKGNKVAGEWFRSPDKASRFHLEVSRRFAREIVALDISDWWDKLWVETRQKQ